MVPVSASYDRKNTSASGGLRALTPNRGSAHRCHWGKTPMPPPIQFSGPAPDDVRLDNNSLVPQFLLADSKVSYTFGKGVRQNTATNG
jgi:hypothetical protein